MGHHLLKTICTWTAYAARPSAVAGAQRAWPQDMFGCIYVHTARTPSALLPSVTNVY